MFSEIVAHKQELDRLCHRFGVRRLELFGSASSDAASASVGDLDFLVDLGDAPPVAYADAYFGLLESLESLFGRPVDLVTEPSVSNRYFRESIARSRRLLYAA